VHENGCWRLIIKRQQLSFFLIVMEWVAMAPLRCVVCRNRHHATALGRTARALTGKREAHWLLKKSVEKVLQGLLTRLLR